MRDHHSLPEFEARNARPQPGNTSHQLVAENGALRDGIVVELEQIRAAQAAASESEQNLTLGRVGNWNLCQAGFTLPDITHCPHLPGLEWRAHSGDVDGSGGIQAGGCPGGVGVRGEQLPQGCE